MTRRRRAERPVPPPPPPPTRLDIAVDLERLARAMDATAAEMVYLGGFGELAAHGLEMAGAAAHARSWARQLRREEGKRAISDLF